MNRGATKHAREVKRRAELKRREAIQRAQKPFYDPEGNQWATELDYHHHVKVSEWLAAKFGPDHGYADEAYDALDEAMIAKFGPHTRHYYPTDAEWSDLINAGPRPDRPPANR